MVFMWYMNTILCGHRNYTKRKPYPWRLARKLSRDKKGRKSSSGAYRSLRIRGKMLKCFKFYNNISRFYIRKITSYCRSKKKKKTVRREQSQHLLGHPHSTSECLGLSPSSSNSIRQEALVHITEILLHTRETWAMFTVPNPGKRGRTARRKTSPVVIKVFPWQTFTKITQIDLL